VLNAGGQLTMTGAVVRGNEAGSIGGSPIAGGLATWYGGTSTLTDCTISGNTVLLGAASGASTMELATR
jgi:hypothetical protein